MGRALLVAALALAGALAAPPDAAAREGDSRSTLFVGTTTFGIEGETTSGVTFGFSYGYEFRDDLLWTAGLSYASTDGTATVSDGAGGTEPVMLEARSTRAHAGLLGYFGRTPGATAVPYVGGGLSVLSYHLEFPGTDVGTVSGTAPGAYAQVGVEVRLTRTVTFIPELGVQVHSVKTESGDTTGLVSGGLVFTLRVGV